MTRPGSAAAVDAIHKEPFDSVVAPAALARAASMATEDIEVVVIDAATALEHITSERVETFLRRHR